MIPNLCPSGDFNPGPHLKTLQMKPSLQSDQIRDSLKVEGRKEGGIFRAFIQGPGASSSKRRRSQKVGGGGGGCTGEEVSHRGQGKIRGLRGDRQDEGAEGQAFQLQI